jgi:hypothetical protein
MTTRTHCHRPAAQLNFQDASAADVSEHVYVLIMKWDVARAAVVRSPRSPAVPMNMSPPNHSANAGSPPVSNASTCCTPKPSADCCATTTRHNSPPPLARVTVCAQLRARPPPQVQGGPPATPPVGLISRPHSGPTVAALAPAQSDLGPPHGSPCSPCTPRGNEQPKRQPPPRPPWRLPAYAARALRRVRGRHLLRCLRVAGFVPLPVSSALPQPRSLGRQRHELLPHPSTGRGPSSVT